MIDNTPMSWYVQVQLNGNAAGYNNLSYGINNGLMRISNKDTQDTIQGNVYYPHILTSIGSAENTIDLTSGGGYRTFNKFDFSVFDNGIFDTLRANNISFSGASVQVLVGDGSSVIAIYSGVIDEARPEGTQITFRCADIDNVRNTFLDHDIYGDCTGLLDGKAGYELASEDLYDIFPESSAVENRKLSLITAVERSDWEAQGLSGEAPVFKIVVEADALRTADLSYRNQFLTSFSSRVIYICDSSGVYKSRCFESISVNQGSTSNLLEIVLKLGDREIKANESEFSIPDFPFAIVSAGEFIVVGQIRYRWSLSDKGLKRPVRMLCHVPEFCFGAGGLTKINACGGDGSLPVIAGIIREEDRTIIGTPRDSYIRAMGLFTKGSGNLDAGRLKEDEYIFDVPAVATAFPRAIENRNIYFEPDSLQYSFSDFGSGDKRFLFEAQSKTDTITELQMTASIWMDAKYLKSIKKGNVCFGFVIKSQLDFQENPKEPLRISTAMNADVFIHSVVAYRYGSRLFANSLIDNGQRVRAAGWAAIGGQWIHDGYVYERFSVTLSGIEQYMRGNFVDGNLMMFPQVSENEFLDAPSVSFTIAPDENGKRCNWVRLSFTLPVKVSNDLTVGEVFADYVGIAAWDKNALNGIEIESGRNDWSAYGADKSPTKIAKELLLKSYDSAEMYAGFVLADEERPIALQTNPEQTVRQAVDEVCRSGNVLVTGLCTGQRRSIDLALLNAYSYNIVNRNFDKFIEDSYKAIDAQEIYNSFSIKYEKSFQKGNTLFETRLETYLEGSDYKVRIVSNDPEINNIDIDNPSLEALAKEMQASASFNGLTKSKDIILPLLNGRKEVRTMTPQSALIDSALITAQLYGWRRLVISFDVSFKDYKTLPVYVGDLVTVSDFVHTSGSVLYGIVQHVGISEQSVNIQMITTPIDKPSPSEIDEQIPSVIIIEEQSGSTVEISE